MFKRYQKIFAVKNATQKSGEVLISEIGFW